MNRMHIAIRNDDTGYERNHGNPVRSNTGEYAQCELVHELLRSLPGRSRAPGAIAAVSTFSNACRIRYSDPLELCSYQRQFEVELDQLRTKSN